MTQWSSAQSRYYANEWDCIIRHTLSTGGERGVLYISGGGATYADGLPGSEQGKVCQAVADAGYAVMSIDAGGLYTFGNATAVARINDAVTYLQSATGHKAASGKVAIIGTSMGAMDAWNYANTYPSKVAAIAGIIPMSDADDIYNNNRGSAAANMNAAYSGNYLTNGTARSPHKLAAALASSLKYRGYYSSNDTIVIPATVTDLVASMGASGSSVNLGAVGHGDASMAGFDTANLTAFIAAGLW